MLVTVGVVFGVYWVGRPTVPDVTAGASASSAASPSAAPALDQAQLAALTAKVTANPKDVASLQKITDLYFAANDWTDAKAAAQKVLDVDPTNEQGLISLGAASYNGGDNASAEKAWKAGIKAHPKNAEMHYDLGFLYMTTGRNERDEDRVGQGRRARPEQRAGQDRAVPGRSRHQAVALADQVT